MGKWGDGEVENKFILKISNKKHKHELPKSPALPHSVKPEYQAISESPLRPDQQQVQVDSDRHCPEEGAGVGEGGHGSLQHTVPGGALEIPQHPIAIGGGRQQVSEGEVDQELASSGPELWPPAVSANNQQ
ncbi:hypothetical protein chiPu_0027917 [Chiloscyllium punctatum]|uniref:Uncharacterized protein n=1 Tax=Chiloscyllium punctatum TaxID=137246 RepID=A0A401TM06_CHIPU|nr:hypothetical protein [Chiloscyllium punctatum]